MADNIGDRVATAVKQLKAVQLELQNTPSIKVRNSEYYATKGRVEDALCLLKEIYI
jgi:hypothetical protein